MKQRRLKNSSMRPVSRPGPAGPPSAIWHMPAIPPPQDPTRPARRPTEIGSPGLRPGLAAEQPQPPEQSPRGARRRRRRPVLKSSAARPHQSPAATRQPVRRRIEPVYLACHDRPAMSGSYSLRVSLLPQEARFARRRPCRCLRPALPLRADALRAGGRGTTGTSKHDLEVIGTPQRPQPSQLRRPTRSSTPLRGLHPLGPVGLHWTASPGSAEKAIKVRRSRTRAKRRRR
jgi:hypothetical protein